MFYKDRFALFTVGILLIAVCLPYALAIAWAPIGSQFLGSFYNSQDTSVYLSAMRAGARGEWLRTLPFTTEPHSPALYYIFYVLLGHLAPPDIVTFHLARLAIVVLLGAAVWTLIGEFLTDVLERRVAFVLSLLGMGFGWLVLIAGLGTRIHSTDIFAPTSSLLGAAMLNPHFPLGVALQFVVFTAYVRAGRTPYRTGILFVGALACLIMSWVLPYQLVLVGAILIVDAAASMWWARKVRTRELRHAFFILLPGSAAILYYESLTHFMPFWSELIQHWPVLEHIFGPADFMAGYGWLFIMALVGAIYLARRPARTAVERFLLVWFGVNALLIIMPLDFADRMSLGFSAKLGLLSSITLMRVLPAWTQGWRTRKWLRTRYPRLRETLPVMAMLVVVPSVILLDFVLPLTARATTELPFYISAADVKAIDWLTQNAHTRDVVLAPSNISNLIPARSDARVYAGHVDETFEPERKLAEIKLFFGGEMSAGARRQFLLEHAINYVYVKPAALGGSAFEFNSVNYLEPVLRLDEVILYRVASDEY